MKQQLREAIWRFMEEGAVGIFTPSPFYGRLPSFRGELFAFNRLTSLERFQKGQTVHVDETKHSAALRKLILDSNKTLATTHPLENSFYRILHRNDIPFHYNARDAIQRPATDFMSSSVALGEPVKIDVVVVRSLAVDPETGERIGVGEGSMRLGSDLEIGVLREIGAADDATCLVTVVHSHQLCDLSEIEMQSYDVPVDVVITPAQTYYTNPSRQKSPKVHWSLLTDHHYKAVPCLKTLESLGKKTTKKLGKKKTKIEQRS